MREYTANDGNPVGGCILIYGDPNSGKTYALASLPDPILIINTEPKDPRRTLMNNPASEGKKITIREHETFDELIDDLAQIKDAYAEGKMKYKSICLDSLSFVQGKFKLDMEDSRFEKEYSLTKSDKRHETLVDRFRIEQADWGGLGSMMKRMTFILNGISKFGVWVVCTSTMMEYPRWNRDLSAAPAIQGRDYGAVFNGFFDFIGLVEPVQGEEPYPPTVRFIGDGSFVCRSSSNALNKKGGKGRLDFEKIIKVIESDHAQ